MNKGLKILKWVAFGLLALTLFGWLTMLLWNWLVPDLFGGPSITFWQSLGLLALTKMLFWSFGGKSSHGSHWKHRYQSRLSSMTPEERARFKEKLQARWCKTDPSSSGV